MSCTVKDIYALRELNRNTVIPASILAAIQLVQQSITKNGTSGTPGKHVEWRNNKPRGGYSGGAKPYKKTYGAAGAADAPQPPQKYVSKFKKASEDIDETILNTILRGKLNKFSQSNYPEIKEFITHIIDGGQTDMIKCFMKLVFEKAASEEIFCPLYAKLISELSTEYPVLLTEMANLYAHYLLIFEHVADGASEDHDGLCQRNIEKKYRRGYSQFLAELIKNNVVDMTIFMQIINKIIEQVEIHMMNKESIKLIEEFGDCLMKIVTSISTSNHQQVRDMRAILKTETNVRIKPLSVRTPECVGMSSKGRFTFLDIYEAIAGF
jgi:hypothetical protein